MIVKKLHRRIQNKWWNKELKYYELTVVTDYMGWFLFGFIPIYLVQLDKQETWESEDKEEIKIKEGILKKYGHLITREKD